MSTASDYRIAAERGDTPLLPCERLWGFWEFTWANSALAIATWAFLIGGSTAAFVGPKEGIAAIVIGNILGVLLAALPTCIPSGKYGTEQFLLMRSSFGANGSRLAYVLAVVLLTLGWLAVLGMMFGRSVSSIHTLVQTGAAVTQAEDGLLVPILSTVAILFSALVVAKGPTSIKFVNIVMAPALFVLMLVMLGIIFQQHDIASLLNLQALAPPSKNSHLNFMIAVEVNIAAGFSWWPYLGNLARLTKNERTSFWPNIIGVFGAAVLGETVGLLGAAALGYSDPTIWMTQIGGFAVGVIALGFVAFANVTSMMNILYTSVIGLRQLGGKWTERISWNTLTFAFCAIPLILVFALPEIYDHFFVFLVWTSALNASLAGIGIADYFVLRKQYIDLRLVYSHSQSPEHPYRYCKGFHPVAILALAAGYSLYFVIFNPFSLAAGPGFALLTASIPAFSLAALTHYLGCKWLGSQRFGGYVF